MALPVIHLDRESASAAFTGWSGEVANYSNLPLAASVVGQFWMVLNASGSRFLLNYKASGLYLSESGSWRKINNAQLLLNDAQFSVYNTLDNTKQIAFDVSAIATATKRTATWQDKSGTVAFLSDVAIGQGTTAEMLASSPSVGERWYNTEDLKFWLYSDKSLWYVPGETVILNKQSGVLTVGEIVVPDPSLTAGAEKATSPTTNEVLGVNVWDVDTELFCVIAIGGIWDVLCSNDSNPYVVSDFLVHDGSPAAEDGKAKRRTSGKGHLAIVLEDGTVPSGGGLLKCLVQTTERY